MDSLWTRSLVYLGLKEEPEDRVDWDTLEAADSPKPATSDASRSAARPVAREPQRESRREPLHDVAPARRAAEVQPSNVRAFPGTGEAAGDRTAVVQVRVFDDVESIGSRYRQRQAVLFDVSAAGDGIARRTVDFVSGLTYASRGRLVKVGPRVFLLVPEGVRIAPEEQRRLSGLGYDVDDAVVG
jgi:cell division inhibitor SepF